MSKRRKPAQQLASQTPPIEGDVLTAAAGKAEAFTFGDPTPVLDGREILD